MEDDRKVPVYQLVMVPTLITFAVTLLRLVGELRNWSPALFGKEAGGGGSIVGISWLVPIFGVYFAIRLVKMGFAPSSVWRALGFGVGAVAIMIAGGFVGTLIFGPTSLGSLFLIGAVSLVAAWVAERGWLALGRTLLAYALGARIPVALVMLAAILANWGTHYDVVPPGGAVMDTWNPLLKWFVIGFVPQFTVWIAFTLAIGMIFGALAAAAVRSRSTAEA